MDQFEPMERGGGRGGKMKHEMCREVEIKWINTFTGAASSKFTLKFGFGL